MNFEDLKLPLGSYGLHEVYFSHDSIILLFSLYSESSGLYALGNVVDEDEETGVFTTLFAIMDEADFTALYNGEIDLRSAFTSAKDGHLISVESNGLEYDNDSITRVDPKTLSTFWLPRRGVSLTATTADQKAQMDAATKKGLYRFHWDNKGMGELEGAFIASADDVASMVGKQVYFGEALGNHSENSGTIREGDIVLVTDDEDAIKALGSFSVGHNPLDHVSEGKGAKSNYG